MCSGDGRGYGRPGDRAMHYTNKFLWPDPSYTVTPDATTHRLRQLYENDIDLGAELDSLAEEIRSRAARVSEVLRLRKEARLEIVALRAFDIGADS